MTATVIAWLAMCGSAAGADASPRFAVALGGVTSDGTEVLCVSGAFPPGQRVTLLFEQESRTCLAKTGAAAQPLASDKPCTTLLDTSACEQAAKLGPWFLAVVGGAQHSFQVHPRGLVDDRARVKALTTRIETTVPGLLTDLARRQRPAPYDRVQSSPGEVFTFAGVSQSPILLRYPVRGRERTPFAPASGALVLVQDGLATMPYDGCPRDPIAFRFDGREYLFGTSSCCDCGWLVDHVHALESGRLRLVFETSARSM